MTADPYDDRLGEWELPDPYFEPYDHADWCGCETCIREIDGEPLPGEGDNDKAD